MVRISSHAWQWARDCLELGRRSLPGTRRSAAAGRSPAAPPRSSSPSRTSCSASCTRTPAARSSTGTCLRIIRMIMILISSHLPLPFVKLEKSCHARNNNNLSSLNKAWKWSGKFSLREKENVWYHDCGVSCKDAKNVDMPCTWTGGSRRMLSAILFSPTSEFWPPLLFVWGVYKISFGFPQQCLRLKTLLISAAAGPRNWAAAGSSTDDSWRPLWSLLASLSFLEFVTTQTHTDRN